MKEGTSKGDKRLQILQSREFATGYLEPNQTTTLQVVSPPQTQRHATADDEVVRGSVQAQQDESQRGRALLNRLAPSEVNSRGHVVVEVDKVVRDLSMLHKTIKMAKFYRILIGSDTTGHNSSTID